MPATSLDEKCDPLCCHVTASGTQHFAKWLLTDQEREAITDTAQKTISNYWKIEPKGKAKPAESKARVRKLFETEDGALFGLFCYLKERLLAETNAGREFFLRLSSLSPKDAYLFLDEDGEEEGSDHEVDVAELARDLELLKIKAPAADSTTESDRDQLAAEQAEYAIQVLLHSERVKLDCQNEEKPLFVLLLPWQASSITGEMRLFIGSKKLIAFSQYFEDLHGCYEGEAGAAENVDKAKKMTGIGAVYDKVLKFWTEQFDKLGVELPDEDVSLDIDMEAPRLIEFNLLKHSDTCFFEREEIMELAEKAKTAGEGRVLGAVPLRLRLKGEEEHTEYKPEACVGVWGGELVASQNERSGVLQLRLLKCQFD